MEQLYAALTGVVSQILTLIAVKYFRLEGGEKATMTTLISFISVVVALSIMEVYGYHYESASTEVVEFGGMAFTVNQLSFFIGRYVLPRVSGLFLGLQSDPK